MKLMIQKLNRDDYNKVYLSYISTDRGKEQVKRLNRLLIVGVVCLILAVIYYFYNAEMGSGNLPIIIGLVVFANIFMFSSMILKRNSLNNYLINNPKILKVGKNEKK